MRCNSLYPVEGEPSPISATKLYRLNSHDRSHYLPPVALGVTEEVPTRIIFIDLALRVRRPIFFFFWVIRICSIHFIQSGFLRDTLYHGNPPRRL